jgi:hypothetical protein
MMAGAGAVVALANGERPVLTGESAAKFRSTD